MANARKPRQDHCFGLQVKGFKPSWVVPSPLGSGMSSLKARHRAAVCLYLPPSFSLSLPLSIYLSLAVPLSLSLSYRRPVPQRQHPAQRPDFRESLCYGGLTV